MRAEALLALVLQCHPAQRRAGDLEGDSADNAELEKFARDKDDPHLEPWRRFNQRVGTSGDVGVYHETYKISSGQHESIYSNMPVTGLAEAGELVPVARRGDSAAERIAASAAS